MLTRQSSTNEIVMWGLPLPTSGMRQADLAYLRDLASRELPTVEWIWQEMDRAWDELALDNKANVRAQAIGEFYSHPVWIVNGVFSATDPVSIQHRVSIAAFASKAGVTRIADYGGGFGELALRLHAAAPEARIDIVEPYASKTGMLRTEGCTGIRFVGEFDGRYDCVVAQDVLEHVANPLKLAEQMVLATRPGGYLILANCFYPVVKCHLPSTFYLRHTFTWVVSALGLKYDGRIEGADHALVFRRLGNINRYMLALFVPIAKLVGPLLNMTIPIIGSIRHRLGT